MGVKVSILSPNAELKDKIIITDELLAKLKENEKNAENIKLKKLKKK